MAAVLCGGLAQPPLPQLPSPIALAPSADGHPHRPSPSPSLRGEASAFAAALVAKAWPDAKVLLEDAAAGTSAGGGLSSSSVPSNATAPAPAAAAATSSSTASAAAAPSPRVTSSRASLESTLFFLLAACKSGDVAHLLPSAGALLSPVLAVVETPDKDFSLVAKSALAYLKHVPFPVRHLPSVAASLKEGAASAGWHTRAAALAFLGPFALKHCFALPAETRAELRGLVVGLLGDVHLEV